ncbi:MAG: hypothetical protein QMD07_05275 [Thermodesulfovibrionales bacterium]|nr:hypothetical protein [Thermodesulfovibrionales bacterium]
MSFLGLDRRKMPIASLVFGKKRDIPYYPVMKKGSRAGYKNGKENMTLKSLESQNVEFKSNWRGEAGGFEKNQVIASFKE